MKHLLFIGLFTSLFISHSFGQLTFEKIVIDQDNIVSDVDEYLFIHIADLNNDDLDDILFFRNESQPYYKLNNGDNNFSPSLTFHNIMDFSGELEISHSDFDNDDDNDVFFLLNNNLIMFNNINSGENLIAETITEGNIIKDYIVYDIDQNGLKDILLIEDSKAYWRKQMTPTNFIYTDTISIVGDNNPKSTYLYDYDSDGNMDIIYKNYDKIMVFSNVDGTGQIEYLELFNLEDSFNNVDGFALTDFDNDGDGDFLVTDGGHLFLIENNEGLFSLDPNFDETIWGITISADDMDNDQDIDLVVMDIQDAVIYDWDNTLGSFNAPYNVELDIDLFTNIGSIHIRDIDRDGHKDLIIPSYTYNPADGSIVGTTVSVFKNKGISINKIVGEVRIDNDLNGCTPLDPLLSNVRVETINENEEILSTFSNNNGVYENHVKEGINITSPIVPDYLDFIPDTSTFILQVQIDTFDFCLTPNQTIDDISISIYPLEEVRPGFQTNYQIVFKNNGTTFKDGDIKFVYPSASMDFVDATYPIGDNIQDTLFFDYENLAPLEVRSFIINMQVLSPPTVEIDQILSIYGCIDPSIGDQFIQDNCVSLRQTVIGSFDPNDIYVSEGDEVHINDKDNYLHYRIRFQNTGTASAINVRVDNLLDDNLDWATLELESTSHDQRVEIINGNEVSFIFDGIYLADSTHNEPESHGYITYRIKPKSTVQLGNIIENQASIYFDFNEAVITNTVSTEFVNIVRVENNINNLAFNLNPIPTQNVVNITCESPIKQIFIYNNLGQQFNVPWSNDKVDLSSLEAGLYYCKIIDINNQVGIQKVIKE